MDLSENIVAAMIGAGATMMAAIFQLTLAFRSRTKADSKPKRTGLGMRSLISIFAIILASAVGGFAYSELRAERVREDIRGLRTELSQQMQAFASSTVRLGQPLDSSTGIDGALTLAAARMSESGRSEASVQVAACRAQPPAFGNDPVGCSAADANQLALCATVPVQASVREVQLFSRPLDGQQPWDQSRVVVEQDAGGAQFTGAPFEVAQDADTKAVCVNYSQWNGERGQAARMIVLYSADIGRTAAVVRP